VFKSPVCPHPVIGLPSHPHTHTPTRLPLLHYNAFPGRCMSTHVHGTL